MEKYIQHFVYRDHRSYSTRVSELIDQMTDSIAEKPAYDALSVRGGRTYEPAGIVRVLRALKKMIWMFWRKIKYYKSVLTTSPQ